MFTRLPKQYRAKYSQPQAASVVILNTVMKILGPVALFFIAAIGFDVYSLIR